MVRSASELHAQPASEADPGYRFNLEQEIKFTRTVEGLKLMDYKAVGFGADDLKLPAASLLVAVGDTQMFVSANAGLFELDTDDVPRFRVIEAGGMKVGVTSVLGDRFQKQITNGEIKFALMHADDGDQEVCALKSNSEFMAYLTDCHQRADSEPRFSLEQVREMYGLPASGSNDPT